MLSLAFDECYFSLLLGSLNPYLQFYTCLRSDSVSRGGVRTIAFAFFSLHLK
jgi:hypothetical protein